MSISLKTQLYRDQVTNVWPRTGRHILAQFDSSNIVVYQAYCPEIASYAVANGKFGGDRFSFTRMTWIKTNFLWMMYRSGWASKRGQERILAITLSQEGFDEILQHARGSGITRSEGSDEVRLQWDPDHDPKGGKVERRAIQLGLRGNMVLNFNDKWIQKIEDVTDFVIQQREFVLNDELDKLVTPSEREYIPNNKDICSHILLEGFAETPRRIKEKSVETVSILDGACCSEMLEENFQMVVQKQCENMKTSETCDIILCLGGAFNPIHSQHVQVMVQSKKWIEENTNYRVIAGYFAVAPDGYVKRKCQKSHEKCMSSIHRIKLAELACAGYDWLHAYDKHVGSASDCGKRVKYENKWTAAKVAVILGADRAVKKSGRAIWHKTTVHLTMCVGRKGETEQMKQSYLEDVELGIANNDNFILIPQELDGVSSSDVRKMLIPVNDATEEVTRCKLVQEIVDLGWLDKRVASYILEHLSEIYIN